MLAKSGFELAGVDDHRNSNHDLVKEAVTLFWYAPLDWQTGSNKIELHCGIGNSLTRLSRLSSLAPGPASPALN